MQALSRSRSVFLVGMLTVSFAAFAGDVFYWKGGYSAWQSWSDLSLWSSAKDSVIMSGHVPGSDPSDLLWPFGTAVVGDYVNYLGKFDLGGQSYTIAGYDLGTGAGTIWKSYQFHLTNGTLVVSDSKRAGNCNAELAYYVWNGAMLDLTVPGNDSASGYRVGVSGLNQRWYVNCGGRMDVRGYAVLMGVNVEVATGGTLNLSNGQFRLCNSCVAARPITVSNSGTMLLPNGLEWTTGDAYSNKDLDKIFTLTHNAGEIRFGGDFKKTGEENDSHRGKMSFVFNGGTLTVEAGKDVAFLNPTVKNGQETFAEVGAGAAVTVQTLADATLDMRLFTYGSGAAVTKTGAGALKISNRPDTLTVSAGKIIFTTALADATGVTLTNDCSVAFCAPGNVIATAPAGYTNITFELDNTSGEFAAGVTVLASGDNAFLQHVSDQIQSSLPTGTATKIGNGALRLVSDSGVLFESDGELDLGDSAGWGGAVPGPDKDVFISGASTVALFGPSTPSFKSITVNSGATLKINRTDADLPPLSIVYPAKLLVAADMSAYMTNGIAAVGGASGLPVIEIATNGTLTVSRGTVLKNLNLCLYGNIAVPDAASVGTYEGITFGGADAGETAYFAMTSIGGNINVSGLAWTTSGCKRFVCPTAGGSVNVVGNILLKDTTFNTADFQNAWVNGNCIGENNPRSAPFTMILDNTKLVVVRNTAIKGSAKVICRNGGGLDKSRARHPGVATFLRVSEYATVECEGESSGIDMPFAETSDYCYFDIYIDGGADQITLRDGAYIAVHKLTGGNHSVLAVSNAFWKVPQLPYVPADNNPCPPDGDPRNWMNDPFTGLHSVRIDAGGKLLFESASILQGTEWDRNVKLANVPITGGGDFVMTNGVPGYGFVATVVASNNTATGSISVAQAADPATLYFNDGANWAGTVVAGNVALTNTASATAPASVAFHSLKLDGEFPVRVWKNSGTNDIVNLASVPVSGTGHIRPVLQDDARFVSGDSFVLGTYPDSAELPGEDCLFRNWKAKSVPSGVSGKVMLILVYQPQGTVVHVK